MSRLLVATRSTGKQAEFRRLLAPLDRELVFPDDVGLLASSEEDQIEVFATFQANASAKAHWFRDRSGLDTLADDSGLEVEALSGAPGVHSKRMSGATGTDREVAARNNVELLRRLRGLPQKARGARYRSVLVLACADRAMADLVVSGTLAGRILEAPLGDGGFGYDPLFWAVELKDSLGRARPEDKDAVSHRARAVRELLARLGGSA